jgi:hypothetical protein
MKKKSIVIITTGLAFALTGLGAGAALAATSTPTPQSSNSAPTATPSTDVEVPDATEAAAVETAGSESSTVSDGNDGGHADPTGADVNHEGGASEK